MITPDINDVEIVDDPEEQKRLDAQNQAEQDDAFNALNSTAADIEF
jgi:hypothetical protein